MQPSHNFFLSWSWGIILSCRQSHSISLGVGASTRDSCGTFVTPISIDSSSGSLLDPCWTDSNKWTNKQRTSKIAERSFSLHQEIHSATACLYSNNRRCDTWSWTWYGSTCLHNSVQLNLRLNATATKLVSIDAMELSSIWKKMWDDPQEENDTHPFDQQSSHFIVLIIEYYPWSTRWIEVVKNVSCASWKWSSSSSTHKKRTVWLMGEVELQLKSVLHPCKTEVQFCNLQNCSFAKWQFCND
jgi:hypothetical protein